MQGGTCYLVSVFTTYTARKLLSRNIPLNMYLLAQRVVMNRFTNDSGGLSFLLNFPQIYFYGSPFLLHGNRHDILFIYFIHLFTFCYSGNFLDL